MEVELQESKAREAARAQELKDKEVELVTVRKEKVILTRELDDAKMRERELTMLLEEAQNQIMELTADEADDLLAGIDIDTLDVVPPPPPPAKNGLPPPPPPS